MLEKYSPGKDFALVAINWDPHQTSRHTPVSTRWKKQHIQRELKYYSRRNFEDTLNQSPWRSDEKTKVLQMKRDQNLGLLTLRDTALPQYAMLSFSWIQWNQELRFIEKAELGRTHLYVNSRPLVPVPCDFPGWSSFLFSHLPNPVIITFFLWNAVMPVNTHLQGLQNSEQNPCWTGKEIEGTLPLGVEKFYGISPKCVVVFYEIFMRALHFSSPIPFMVGLFLLFFCNRDFIFKYEIVIMRKGSLSPELHSCIHNFFWLMWKQLPHQSFSPGPIICKHQMEPHIAMQIIVPRDLQYNHPVTRKVKRRGNYHNGPQNLHMMMLRGLDGRFHHHSKDMLAFLWKCVLLGRKMLLTLSWRNLIFSFFLVVMDWAELFIFSHLNCEMAN